MNLWSPLSKSGYDTLSILIGMIELSESLPCPSLPLDCPSLMSILFYGLPHSCNSKPHGKPKLFYELPHSCNSKPHGKCLCHMRAKGNMELKLYSLSAQPHYSLLLTKLGTPCVGRKLFCKAFSSQNVNKGCGNTSLLPPLLLLFSLTNQAEGMVLSGQKSMAEGLAVILRNGGGRQELTS